MSETGHLQTCPAQDDMSASPLKADIRASGQHVRYWPFASFWPVAGLAGGYPAYVGGALLAFRASEH